MILVGKRVGDATDVAESVWVMVAEGKEKANDARPGRHYTDSNSAA